MDQMKPRCWYEGQMPLVALAADAPADTRALYERRVEGMVKAAVEIAGNLRQAVRKALFGTVTAKDARSNPRWDVPPGVTVDKQLFEALTDAFWQNTEPAFFTHLEVLGATIAAGEDDPAPRRAWHKALCDEAERLFGLWVGDQEAPRDTALLTAYRVHPKSVVWARKELGRFNHQKRIVEDALGLPPRRDSDDSAA